MYYSKEFSSSINNIALRKSTDGGATWNGRIDVTTNTVAISPAPTIPPALAIDSSNNLYVAYYSKEFSSTKNNIALRKSTDGGATWNGRVDITASTTLALAQNPAIAIDTANNLYVTYYSKEFNSTQNIALRTSTDGGATWGARVDITTSTVAASGTVFPFMAFDAFNSLYIAYPSADFNAFNNVALRKSTNSGVTWSERIDVTTSTATSAAPAMAVDASNNLYVVYNSTEFNSRNNIVLRKSMDNGATWSNRVDITTNTPASSLNSALTLDSSGNFYTIYNSTELNSSFNNIAFRSASSTFLYFTSGNIISSPFDSTDSANIISEIDWDENSLPASTTVSLYLRTGTSQDNINAASWSAALTNSTTGCAKVGSTVTCGASAIPTGLQDASGDEWFQYQAALTGGTSTPYVDNVIIKYGSLAAPTTIATSAINTGSITISWTDNSGIKTAFSVEKSTDGTAFTVASTTAADVTSTSINGLAVNTAYWFRVAAIYLTVTSTYVTTSISTYTLANVPTLVSVAGTSNGITFGWTGDATAYYAEDITAGTNSGWTTAAAFGVSGINCGTTHNFRVKGRNGDGTETAFTSAISGTTNICGVAILTNPSSNGSESSNSPFPPADQVPPTENVPTVSPTPAFIFIHTLRIGWKGEEVKQLQQKLKNLGYFKYPRITGYFGPITKAAVIAFQKAHGLSPVGLVGPLTRALLNALNSK